MIELGIISTIEANMVRVILPEHDDIVSSKIEIAKHININNLEIGDNVLISFFNSGFKNGVIIAELR